LAARRSPEKLSLVLDFCFAFESALSDENVKLAASKNPLVFLNRFFPPKASRFFLEYVGIGRGRKRSRWTRTSCKSSWPRCAVLRCRSWELEALTKAS
jgi:hypothetical protein